MDSRCRSECLRGHIFQLSRSNAGKTTLLHTCCTSSGVVSWRNRFVTPALDKSIWTLIETPYRSRLKLRAVKRASIHPSITIDIYSWLRLVDQWTYPATNTCDTGYLSLSFPVKPDRERICRLGCTRTPGTAINQRQIAVIRFCGQFHAWTSLDFTHISCGRALRHRKQVTTLIKYLDRYSIC